MRFQGTGKDGHTFKILGESESVSAMSYRNGVGSGFTECFGVGEGYLRLKNTATASLPSSPDEGAFVYDSTAKLPKFHNGTNWTSLGAGDAWGDPVDADIIPDADGTRDLGATGTRFAETYTDALDVTNNATVGGNLTVDTILEASSNTGVTVEQVLMENGEITLSGPAYSIDTANGNSPLFISGGTTPSLGANIKLHGESVTSTADDMDFRTDTTTNLYWDNSAGTWDFQSNDILANGVEISSGSTVAGLPGTPAIGMIRRVTDADTPSVGSTVTGGSSAAALVWYNGSNWTVIGV